MSAVLKPKYDTEKTSMKPTQKESPQVTARRLHKKYKTTINAFIASLSPLCDNLKNDEVFTIQGLEDGYVHVIYGDKHFYFPDEIVTKVSLTDWRNIYDLEIDNKEVLVHNPMDIVPGKVENSFRRTAMDTVLPGTVKDTSKNIGIKRSFRIKKRNQN